MNKQPLNQVRKMPINYRKNLLANTHKKNRQVAFVLRVCFSSFEKEDVDLYFDSSFVVIYLASQILRGNYMFHNQGKIKSQHGPVLPQDWCFNASC
jgi:hypothetical protein